MKYFKHCIFIQCLKYFNQNTNGNFNNFLFDSIKSDYFNNKYIFNYNYTNIKIKKYASNNNKTLICVLGVLVNNPGLIIEKELTNWLENEYIIYKVYQKYPGTLYEYPALKFAQWLVEEKNISFLLYLHTKGATHKKVYHRDKIIRNLWKNEFTKPRNQLYISQLINNKADVVTPLRKGYITWYNGMYISKKAFQLNNIIFFKNRYIYEIYFRNNLTRIKGIISDRCLNTTDNLKLFDNKNIKEYYKNNNFHYISKIMINNIYKHNFLKQFIFFLIILIIKFYIR